MPRHLRLAAALAATVSSILLVVPAARGGTAEAPAGGPTLEIATLDTGKVAFAVTNYGQLGKWGYAAVQPFSCEYPKGSKIEHLFGGAVWVGGILNGDTLVSTGNDGWLQITEFYPNEGPKGRFFERRGGTPGAISNQDLGTIYMDTLTDQRWVPPDPLDGPHRPLNIQLVQVGYAWSDPAREDFVLLDLVVKNIGIATIQDAWLGIYLDADVFHRSRLGNGFADDISGYLNNQQIAYILDNDGDPNNGAWDSTSTRAAIALRTVYSDPPLQRVNFNWWATSSDSRFDWGPRRIGTPEDPYRDFGTGGEGTPEGDRNKYYVLSHNEQDYDQLWAAADMTSQGWMASAPIALDLADGWDTRFLYSFGPYTINPGSSIRVILGVVMGDLVHVGPADFAGYFTPSNPQAFYDRLDFNDLLANVAVAESVAVSLKDVNTGCFDFDNDGICFNDDVCPLAADPENKDSDDDGVGDICDNCPLVTNPAQEDLNHNGIGDSCEVSRTWRVKADGTGDMPTIQAAIDASYHGDTVLVADGIFSGPGNRDLQLHGRRISLRSEHGPDHTVIYCDGRPADPHRGFYLQYGGDTAVTIEGFTIRRGYAISGGGMELGFASPQIVNCVFRENRAGYGGGLFSGCASSPRLLGCTFVDNVADAYGGGMFAACDSKPVLVDCTFSRNSAANSGGGLSCWDASPQLDTCRFLDNRAASGAAVECSGASVPVATNCVFARNAAEVIGGGGCFWLIDTQSPAIITNCTFSQNSAAGDFGAGISLLGNGAMQMENTIIAFSPSGAAVSCAMPDMPLTVSCCDIFGNAGGDWTECLSPWAGIDGNMSIDPRFVDTTNNNFSVLPESPCAPPHNACSSFIGLVGFCECAHIGDTDGNGDLSPVDIVRVVDYVFWRGTAPPADPLCPAPNRGDYNCDGLVNLVDVVGMVNFVYRGQGQGPCDPCGR